MCFGARGGLPLRYVRDLRPLTAIPLDATSASLHTPPHSRTMVAPWGTPDEIRPGSTAWPPAVPPVIPTVGIPGSAELVLGRPLRTVMSMSQEGQGRGVPRWSVLGNHRPHRGAHDAGGSPDCPPFVLQRGTPAARSSYWGEGRSCGTGGDPAYFKERMHLLWINDGGELGGDRTPRLLGGDGEPRPDATGDAPCGEAKIPRAAAICRKVRLTSGGAAGNFLEYTRTFYR
jgi:hypothetical protein